MESVTFKDQLIEAVRNRPEVWNTKLSAFRELKTKEESWKEVAKSLNSTVEHCQYIYKKLRDTFVRKRASIVENPEILKRNRWKYFESLMFLDEHCKARKKESIRLLSVIESMSSPPTASNLFAARNEFKYNLINEVRFHQNLWNSFLPSFHDDASKQRTWKQIGKNLNTTGKECRTTFTVLRDAYFQIYSERDNPKWEYYDSLKFLDSVGATVSTVAPKVEVLSGESSSDTEGHHALKFALGEIHPVIKFRSYDSSSDLDGQNSSESFAPKIINTSTIDLSSFHVAPPQHHASPSSLIHASPSPIHISSSLKRSRPVEPTEPIPSMSYSQIILNDELDIFGTSVILKLRRMKASIRDDVIFKIETALHHGLQQSNLIKDENS